MVLVNSQHVKITKVSDNAVSHSFVLAEGGDGQPLVKLGSREREAAKAGGRGVIVIESLHRGSGQHVSRDPMMYEFADGMFADYPGILRNRGAIIDLGAVATNAAFRFGARGGLSPARLFLDPDEAVIIIPSGIYTRNSSGSPTLRQSTISGNLFTGAFAPFGGYIYFGAENNTNGVATWAARYDGAAEASTWTNNAGFNASFLASKADKLWRTSGGGSVTPLSLSWSDDAGNATPIFSAGFDLQLGQPHPIGLGIIGSHALVAIYDAGRREDTIVAIDNSGNFTPILDVLPNLDSMVSYLSGALVFPVGAEEGVWMRDITSYQFLNIRSIPTVRGQMARPALIHGQSSGAVNGGGVSALGRQAIIPVYGTMTKRDGNAVTGSCILLASLDEDGFHVHPIATPETMSALTNAHVMATQIVPYLDLITDPTPNSPLAVQVLVATAAANAAQSNSHLYAIELPRGTSPPNSFASGMTFLRTSRYPGDSWVTKKMEMLRGYVTQLPAASNAVVRVYLDGATAEATNFSINAVGPFAQSLPVGTIGRDVA